MQAGAVFCAVKECLARRGGAEESSRWRGSVGEKSQDGQANRQAGTATARMGAGERRTGGGGGRQCGDEVQLQRAREPRLCCVSDGRAKCICRPALTGP